jgi:hypothetical protein
MAELRADPRAADPRWQAMTDNLGLAFAELDLEGDGNKHAVALSDCLSLFESVIEASHKREQHRLSRENLGDVANLAERRRLFLGAANESAAAGENELSSDSKTDIADCFLRLADLPTFALDRLSRYEHTLWRQARQIVFMLESLRHRRRQPSGSSFPFRRCPCAVSVMSNIAPTRQDQIRWARSTATA